MDLELKNVTALNVKELVSRDFKLEVARPNTLENVRQINVIIGANSAGKSRFMRTVFSESISH